MQWVVWVWKPFRSLSRPQHSPTKPRRELHHGGGAEGTSGAATLGRVGAKQPQNPPQLSSSPPLRAQGGFKAFYPTGFGMAETPPSPTGSHWRRPPKTPHRPDDPSRKPLSSQNSSINN